MSDSSGLVAVLVVPVGLTVCCTLLCATLVYVESRREFKFKCVDVRVVRTHLACVVCLVPCACALTLCQIVHLTSAVNAASISPLSTAHQHLYAASAMMYALALFACFVALNKHSRRELIDIWRALAAAGCNMRGHHFSAAAAAATNNSVTITHEDISEEDNSGASGASDHIHVMSRKTTVSSCCQQQLQHQQQQHTSSSVFSLMQQHHLLQQQQQQQQQHAHYLIDYHAFGLQHQHQQQEQQVGTNTATASSVSTTTTSGNTATELNTNTDDDDDDDTNSQTNSSIAVDYTSSTTAAAAAALIPNIISYPTVFNNNNNNNNNNTTMTSDTTRGDGDGEFYLAEFNRPLGQVSAPIGRNLLVSEHSYKDLMMASSSGGGGNGRQTAGGAVDRDIVDVAKVLNMARNSIKFSQTSCHVKRSPLPMMAPSPMVTCEPVENEANFLDVYSPPRHPYSSTQQQKQHRHIQHQQQQQQMRSLFSSSNVVPMMMHTGSPTSTSSNSDNE